MDTMLDASLACPGGWGWGMLACQHNWTAVAAPASPQQSAVPWFTPLWLCCAALLASLPTPYAMQLLQGVFSALGNMGQPPAAAGQPPQGPQPTHLLQSIADFLQQLQSQPSAGGEVAMPVTSLALGGTTGGQAAAAVNRLSVGASACG